MRSPFHFFRITGLVLTFLLTASFAAVAGWFNFGKTLQGTITDVDPNYVTVTKMTNSEIREMNFKVDPATKFKKVNSVNQLKEGDHVKVKYTEDDGRKVALNIDKLMGGTKVNSAVSGTNMNADNASSRPNKIENTD